MGLVGFINEMEILHWEVPIYLRWSVSETVRNNMVVFHDYQRHTE